MVQHPYIAIVIFAAVYFLIIFGRGKFKIPIWASMLTGAALMVGFQVISIESASKSINLDVMGFLFGMFSIVSALDMSGVLRMVALKMLSMTNGHPDLILMVFVVGMGLLSAFLVNDTIAVMAIPIIAHISWQIGIRPQVFLIALSFGITIGSTMTPIGNPQNLLIALQSGIPLPFLTFVKVLGIPTIVNLFATFFILKTYFKRDLALSPALLPNQHNRKQEQQQQQQLQKRQNSRPPKRNNQKIRHSYFSKHEPILFPSLSKMTLPASGAFSPAL